MDKERAGDKQQFDDAMRARLYFYDQLAAPFPGTKSIRRGRKERKRYQVPEDVAEQFIERVGLAHTPTQTNDGSAIIPVRQEPTYAAPYGLRTFNRERRDIFADTKIRSKRASASTSSIARTAKVVARFFGTVLASPFRAPGWLLQRLNRDTSHYASPTLQGSDLSRKSWRKFFVITGILLALTGIAGGSYVYLHQQSLARQEAAEQAQFEKERKAWLCALAKFETSQGKEISKEATCAQ